ncbi:hypothetical protein YC2023_105735 [Brassica napus]
MEPEKVSDLGTWDDEKQNPQKASNGRIDSNCYIKADELNGIHLKWPIREEIERTQTARGK